MSQAYSTEGAQVGIGELFWSHDFDLTVKTLVSTEVNQFPNV